MIPAHVPRPGGTARLGDFCDAYSGISRRSPKNVGSVRMVTGADVVQATPFSELRAGFDVDRNPPDHLRLRAGDILIPRVMRHVRARFVDTTPDTCFAHHTIAILRPRPGAPSSSYLADYLSSAAFFEAVKRYATDKMQYDTLRLRTSALLDIPFTVPTDAERPSGAVIRFMDQFIRNVIRAIARNEAELDSVEWRTLEYVLATALEEFGFEADLTRAAKDGGKDIVLKCTERGTNRRYVVEVKHWRSGQAVPGSHLRKFLKVIVNEQHDAGLLLSTSGFARNAYDALIHVEHRRIRMAGRSKVVNLCRTYVMRESGLLTSTSTPTEVLFDGSTGLSI